MFDNLVWELKPEHSNGGPAARVLHEGSLKSTKGHQGCASCNGWGCDQARSTSIPPGCVNIINLPKRTTPSNHIQFVCGVRF